MAYKWLVLIVLFFISCKSESDVPDNILPVNEMKVVMWNIIQADEYANLSIAPDSSKNLKQETLKLYSKVFYQHKISSDDFGRSYNYYKQHPAIEKALLDSIQAYGSKMKEASYQKVRLALPLPSVPVDTSLKN